MFACLAGTRTSCLPDRGCRLPLCFALEPSGISDRSSKLAAALWCEMNANCFVCMAGTRTCCLLTEAAAFLFALNWSRQGSSTDRASLRLLFVAIVGAFSSVQGGCKLCACLSGTHTSCLPTEVAAFLFALHRSRQGSPTDRASLRLPFGARWMQNVCLPGCHSHELLVDRGCGLPLCLAPTPSGISDQSSKLVAALRCAPCRLFCGARWIHTVCLFGRHSHELLAGQRLPPSSLLCTGVVRDLRPIEQACGCFSVRGGCTICACLVATRTSCLPTEAAAFLFALHWSHSISDQSSKLVAALRCAPCRLLFGARWIQTVCLFGRHSHELLADKGCHLPLCFAPEP